MPELRHITPELVELFDREESGDGSTGLYMKWTSNPSISVANLQLYSGVSDAEKLIPGAMLAAPVTDGDMAGYVSFLQVHRTNQEMRIDLGNTPTPGPPYYSSSVQFSDAVLADLYVAVEWAGKVLISGPVGADGANPYLLPSESGGTDFIGHALAHPDALARVALLKGDPVANGVAGTVELMDLVDDVTDYVRGAPDPVILPHILRGARELCRETGLWTVVLGVDDIPPSDRNEALTVLLPSFSYPIPHDAQLMQVARVRLDTDTLANPQSYYYNDATSSLVFVPDSLHGHSSMEIMGTLAPSRGAATLPGFLTEKWDDAITAYAKWRMLTMPDKQWSNPQLAIEYHGEYLRRMADARVYLARRGANAPIEVQPVPFV